MELIVLYAPDMCFYKVITFIGATMFNFFNLTILTNLYINFFLFIQFYSWLDSFVVKHIMIG